MSGADLADLGFQFGFQGRVDQLEAQLEAATLGQNPSLEAQFRELELNDEIERELARLKGQKVEA